MEVVADANTVIAALISPTGHTADIFFSSILTAYAPELLTEEISEHKTELLLKTGLSEEEFNKALALLVSRIKFFPIEEILAYLPEAREISPDPDDLAYFALALKLDCPLWSNDKQLKLQNRVMILSTPELLKLLSGKH